jgi:hypothetical protein
VNSILTSQRVQEIYADCLFLYEEDTNDGVEVEGIHTKVLFHPDRLAIHKTEIEALMDELPEGFKKTSKDEGLSFLAACQDRHGNQWTDFHGRMEQLFLLGMAVGKAQCLAPKVMWPFLPGGVPFYAIN